MLFVTVPWIGLQLLIWQQHSSRSPFLLPVFNATCFLDVSSCRRNSCHFTFWVDKQSWNSTVWSCLGGCTWLPVALRPLRAHRQNRVGFCHWAQLGSAWRAELQEQYFALLEAVEHHGWKNHGELSSYFVATVREPGGSLDSYCKCVLDKQKMSSPEAESAQFRNSQRWPVTQNEPGNAPSISKVILCEPAAALAFWKAEWASGMAEDARNSQNKYSPKYCCHHANSQQWEQSCCTLRWEHAAIADHQLWWLRYKPLFVCKSLGIKTPLEEQRNAVRVTQLCLTVMRWVKFTWRSKLIEASLPWRHPVSDHHDKPHWGYLPL